MLLRSVLSAEHTAGAAAAADAVKPGKREPTRANIDV